jgi:hypothetical protein
VYSTFIDSLLESGVPRWPKTPANENDNDWRAQLKLVERNAATAVRNREKTIQLFPIPNPLDAKVGRLLYQLNGKTAKGKTAKREPRIDADIRGFQEMQEPTVRGCRWFCGELCPFSLCRFAV